MFVWLWTCHVHAAIVNYNQFPTSKPSHILDEKLTNISFAFSMRVLESDYNGPLVKLRRASDNALQDFSWGDNDIVDVAAIDVWRAGSNVYVHTWYDQSGLGRNAVQTINNRQPQFFTDANRPYFKGDGYNDYLTVDTPNGIQDVTNNGKEGSVLAIVKATTLNQHIFGVLDNTVSPSNRWSAHINWGNNRAYFDPGSCCVTNARSFENSANVGMWVSYTFIRTSTKIIMRASGVDKLNTNLNMGNCTLTSDFAIGWATGNEITHGTSASIMEMIMYKIDINTLLYQEIEENMILFWSL